MTQNRLLWSACLVAGATFSPLAAQTGAKAPEFTAPVRLQAGGEPIRTEAPGYAAPCWADVDGDGRKDLVVGQFKKGRMKVYRNLGEGQLAEGRWLEAEGKTAEVPGVW